MLILTRRIGEALNIGDDIEVVILGVKGNQVRIGIAAPKSVPVHREEIHNKIAAERDRKPALRVVKAAEGPDVPSENQT